MRETDGNQSKSVPRRDVAFHKIVKNHSATGNNRAPRDCNQPDCSPTNHTAIQINKQWHNEGNLPLYDGKSLQLMHHAPVFIWSRRVSVCFRASSHDLQEKNNQDSCITLQPVQRVWREDFLLKLSVKTV